MKVINNCKEQRIVRVQKFNFGIEKKPEIKNHIFSIW